MAALRPIQDSTKIWVVGRFDGAEGIPGSTVRWSAAGKPDLPQGDLLPPWKYLPCLPHL